MWSVKSRYAATFLCGATATLFLGCASQPDYAALNAEGVARHVPLLIYGTGWNNPHERLATRKGDPVPDYALEVDLINTREQEVSSVTLHVQRCATKGSSSDSIWLHYLGPFEPQKPYKALPTLPKGVTTEQLLPYNKLSHMMIVGISVEDSSGKIDEHTTDVSGLLTSTISNFCAAF